MWFATNPANEGWRIWASFFLGGLYAPIASSYLLSRERAGIAGKTLPPPPSNRGLVVLSLFVGLPALSLISLMYMDRLSDVANSLPAFRGYKIGEAHHFAVLNMFVSWFYFFSLMMARRVERNFALLLYETTAGSAAAVAAFRKSSFSRLIASVVACTPLVIMAGMGFTMRWFNWHESLAGMGAFYIVALISATWATSWLHISPIHRFRAAALASSP
ncbi:MAG: hypothetical protein ACJAYU_003333 [Bradymonadia bacterium]|jgi:hypothetical protein